MKCTAVLLLTMVAKMNGNFHFYQRKKTPKNQKSIQDQITYSHHADPYKQILQLLSFS